MCKVAFEVSPERLSFVGIGRVAPRGVKEILEQLDVFDARYKEHSPDQHAIIAALLFASRQIRERLTTVPNTFPSWKEWEPDAEAISVAQYWLGYLFGCDLFLDPNEPRVPPHVCCHGHCSAETK